jgi:hypothetical protein
LIADERGPFFLHSLHSGLVLALFTDDFVENPCAEYARDKKNHEDDNCDVSLEGEVGAPVEGRHCVVDSRMWWHCAVRVFVYRVVMFCQCGEKRARGCCSKVGA